MIWFLISVTVLNFLTTTAICGFIFEIVQNTNDSRILVSTKMETISGSNVSLTCKIADSENKEYSDHDVVWFKRRKGLGYKPEMLGFSNLSFGPIMARNQGKYLCVSLKYNLHKPIQILVKPLTNLEKRSKKIRQKRAEINSNIPSPDSVMHNSESTIGNLPIPVPTSNQHNHWNRETYTLSTDVKRLFKENQNQFYDYSSSNYKSRTSFSGKGISYAGVIAAVVAVILIVGGLLYRLMKRFDLYAISPERISDAEPSCQHPSCGQYCTFAASRENGQNRCQSVHIVNPTNNNDHDIPTLRVLPSLVGISNNSRAERDEQIHTIDLPPSYDNSVKDCDNDKPPTYNEALSYMSVGHLPNPFPVAQSFNQTLSRQT